MSKIWLVSDTHFNHHKIIEYSKRPFANVDEMNEGLIQKWNAVVSDQDTVFHLGDVAMGGAKKADQVAEFLFRLKGKINLIKGNHDSFVLKDRCRDRFDWVKNYYELIYNHKLITLQHFPLLTWNSAGKIDKDGKPMAFHLHGHCHGSIDHLNANTTRMDVGVDSQNYTPVTLDSIVEIMNQRTYQAVDHHGAKTNYY